VTFAPANLPAFFDCLLQHRAAWTGSDEPNRALNLALAARGRGDQLRHDGNWDRPFAREGRDQYTAFADGGLTMICTNGPERAVQDLDANDGADG